MTSLYWPNAVSVPAVLSTKIGIVTGLVSLAPICMLQTAAWVVLSQLDCSNAYAGSSRPTAVILPLKFCSCVASTSFTSAWPVAVPTTVPPTGALSPKPAGTKIWIFWNASSAGFETPPEMIRLAPPELVGVIASFGETAAPAGAAMIITPSAEIQAHATAAKRFMALPSQRRGLPATTLRNEPSTAISWRLLHRCASG